MRAAFIGRRRSECKDEACTLHRAVCRERAFDFLEAERQCTAAVPLASRLAHYQRPVDRKRRRDDSDDSDDAYNQAQLLVAKARSLTDRCGSQQEGQEVALSASSEAGPSQLNMGTQEACLEVEVARERCPICLDGFEGEPQGRPDGHAVLQSWGFTRCCGSPFHFTCLSCWLLDDEQVDCTSGPVALPTYCPQCRSNRLAPTSTRMLQSTRRGM